MGYNHTIAVANDGGVWTWGFGGYGRLGHKVQQVGGAPRAGARALLRLVGGCAPEARSPRLAAAVARTASGSWNPQFASWRIGACHTPTPTHPTSTHPQDEFKPRLVEALAGRITVPADAVVAAGQTASFCTIVGGQLFAWGKLKPSGAPARPGRRLLASCCCRCFGSEPR